MPMHLRRGLVAAIVLAVALGAAGAYAYAAATGDGVIKACALKATGHLRLDTGRGCLSFESPVEWNQTGPQGPQGPAGRTHVDERFFARTLADPSTWLPITVGAWPAVRPSMTRITTSHLAAGNYTVSAEVIGRNRSGVGTLVCLLGSPSTGYTVAQAGLGNQGGYAIQQTITAQAAFALTQDTDIDLSCFSAPQGGDGPAGDPAVGFADVLATTVDAFTSTQDVH
jgi:hypothetical protein